MMKEHHKSTDKSGLKQWQRTWLRKLFGLTFLLLSLGLVGAWQVAKSRSFQFFGQIVPRVETTQKRVALSFDDGPVPGATDEILAILAARNVRASFFVTGKDVRAQPELTARIVDAGHELGNHSYSHQRMLFMPYAEVAWEIERTQELIRQAGQQEPIYFRPPYGKKWLNLPLYLSLNGITTVTWDVEPDSDRAIAKDATRIAEQTLQQVRPGSIVLLHVMYPSRKPSMEALPAIIQGLRDQGYQLVTVSELLDLGA